MIYTRTPRLLLRDWQDEDSAAFAAMNADPLVMRYFPAPLTADESAALLGRLRAEFADEGFGAYAVERISDGRLLGFTGLHRVAFAGELHGKIEIGWRYCADAWGHGYATEAAQACLDLAEKLGIDEIYAFTTLTNLPSQRVMQRLEMTRLGEFDHPELSDGHPLLRHVLYRK